MHASHLLGLGAVLAVAATMLVRSEPAAPAAAAPDTTALATPAAPPAEPEAGPTHEPPTEPPTEPQGHYVLVVEGDRNHLDVTFARHKPAPWAGVPKGFTSTWLLRVRDADGDVLGTVPLDVRPFATGAADVGKPAEVRGCVVVDSRIGMLVNVPAFPNADRYELVRPGEQAEVVIGAATGERVRELAGGGR